MFSGARVAMLVAFLLTAGCSRSPADSSVAVPPRAVCLGTLETCEQPGAAFTPYDGTTDVGRLLPGGGRAPGDALTLAYRVTGDRPVLVEGASTRLRARSKPGDQSATSGPLLIDAADLVRAPNGSLLVEVTLAGARALWAVPAHEGSVAALQRDALNVAAPALVLIGWMLLAAVQQLVAPKSGALSIGARSLAVLTLGVAARVAALQHTFVAVWTSAPLVQRAVEVTTVPVLNASGGIFYLWLVGKSLAGPGIRAWAGAGVLLACANILLVSVVPLRNPLLDAGYAYACVTIVLLGVNIAKRWAHIHPAERRLVGVGVGAAALTTIADILVTRLTGNAILGTGLAPMGLAVETLCQAMILSHRNARAHAKVDELAGELDAKNVALTATNALLEVSNTKLEDTNGILASELDERRRLQGELDTAAQQLTQAENMATLGMLMAGIAHDLRNPLNYVQGAAEQLREAIPSLRSGDDAAREKTIGRVEKVVGWVEQGTASMDAISLAMRNQARGGGAVLETMNLRDVVNEALLLCKSRLAGCDVAIDVQNATIVADPTGVGQLVMNLVSNAADALKEAQEKAPRESLEIRVVGAVADGQVILEVHDSGPGIPEPLRAKILEPFFTTKPRGQGTGLGLAIVQRVVKQHGGSLQIARSDALGGASFLVRWGNET